MTEPDELRDWAAAERIAVQAEEMVRAALARHLEGSGPLPTLDMQRQATEVRQRADIQLRAIMAKNKSP